MVGSVVAEDDCAVTTVVLAREPGWPDLGGEVVVPVLDPVDVVVRSSVDAALPPTAPVPKPSTKPPATREPPTITIARTRVTGRIRSCRPPTIAKAPTTVPDTPSETATIQSCVDTGTR